jgi:hypothetical protein
VAVGWVVAVDPAAADRAEHLVVVVARAGVDLAPLSRLEARPREDHSSADLAAAREEEEESCDETP